MPEEGESRSYEAFAQILENAFKEVRLHSPQPIPQVEERLRSKLGTHGVSLSPDIMRALAFALVEDRGS